MTDDELKTRLRHSADVLRDMLYDDLAEGCSRTVQRLDNLRAELEAAEKDAARYRWLKINARRIDFAGLCVSDGAQLDARIDAARKD